jgi:outer membrane lipoprotein-sorting protein
LILLFFLVATGCVKTTTVLPPDQRLLPAKSATRSELLESLMKKGQQIGTLKATINIDASHGGAATGVLDEYRQTKGYVFVDRPVHIRMQIQAPVVSSTVAIMVSDGQEYRVSIPLKNEFAIEDVNAPIDPKNILSSLRPQIILEGLFVDITELAKKPSVKSFIEEEIVGIRSYYIFSFFDTASDEPELLQRIWIDRADLEVSRKQVFGKDGRLEQDVEYQDYHNENRVSYPKLITIRRPIEGVTLKITFQQTTLNDTLDAKLLFDLPRPEGSKLLQLTK